MARIFKNSPIWSHWVDDGDYDDDDDAGETEQNVNNCLCVPKKIDDPETDFNGRLLVLE